MALDTSRYVDPSTITPGPQQPNKYPRVGNNYRKFGEQKGFVYHYPTDSYYADPKALRENYQDQGIIDKPPSLGEQLLPIGAAAGGMALATEGGKVLPGAIGGLLGMGSATEAGAAGAAGAAASGATAAGAAGGAGAGAGLGAAAPVAAGEAAGATGAAGAGLAGAAVPAAGALAALATVLEGRSALNMLKGKQKNWKDASLVDNLGRGLLGLSTFGGSEVANALFGGHKSTKDVQAGRTDELKKMSEDAAWQNYLGGMRGEAWQEGHNKENPYAGKYKTFDEYKKAGLEAGDLTGVYGNLKTFGPEYGSLDFAKQKQLTQGLIDAGLYDSSKGDVIVTDEAKAKQIAKNLGLLGV